MDFSNVKAILFDVDGVFTDSSLIVMEDGSLLRQMNTRDGYIIRQAVKMGLHLGVITGGTSGGVTTRLNKLGIQEIYSGVSDKQAKLEEFSQKHGYQNSDILFVGDDYPDWQVLHLVGYPCCPSDADPAIAEICKYVSPFKGGFGCVRDIVTKVLLSKNLPIH